MSPEIEGNGSTTLSTAAALPTETAARLTGLDPRAEAIWRAVKRPRSGRSASKVEISEVSIEEESVVAAASAEPAVLAESAALVDPAAVAESAAVVDAAAVSAAGGEASAARPRAPAACVDLPAWAGVAEVLVAAAAVAAAEVAAAVEAVAAVEVAAAEAAAEAAAVAGGKES